MTYRLEKIERLLLLFELDYKVMDVSTHITVNISYIFNCTDPDMKVITEFFPICEVKKRVMIYLLAHFCEMWSAAVQQNFYFNSMIMLCFIYVL